MVATTRINYQGEISMSRLIELKLKKEALQKKLAQIEAELELTYFQIDKEMEDQLETNT